MRIKLKKHLNLIRLLACVFSVSLLSAAHANVHNLQIGQSKTLVLPQGVSTVFISQDSVAN